MNERKAEMDLGLQPQQVTLLIVSTPRVCVQRQASSLLGVTCRDNGKQVGGSDLVIPSSCQPATQPASQPASHPASQPACQPASQLTSSVSIWGPTGKDAHFFRDRPISIFEIDWFPFSTTKKKQSFYPHVPKLCNCRQKRGPMDKKTGPTGKVTGFFPKRETAPKQFWKRACWLPLLAGWRCAEGLGWAGQGCWLAGWLG